MIVRPKSNLVGVLTSLKGSIAKRIARRSLMVTLLTSAIVLIETLHPSYLSKVSATLLGLSLSIFMSFRNNVCYDRWYVRTIERDVQEALGVTQLPPHMEPVDFVLN